ncbi:hypothetical protein IWX90DRAFT_6490 [Phyllosticta citrichinensis]|uniref:Uncharacterized protein n=1 Tax=Phyllosticta citrichinensis TaxID=1130410 RepID=A0ABR1Y5Y9_9PEZI
MPAHEAQPEPDQSDPSDQSDHSGQSDHQSDHSDDNNMKDSTRSKALRKRRPPPKKKTRDEPSEAKPLNQNDLVKWIVISDAPDHASVHSKFCNAKGHPVLPRSSKYLDRFGARNLRTGLKCLRAMTDSARQENERLEQEAQALGCVDDKMNVEQQLGTGEERHLNTAKAVVDDADSSMQVDASKESRIATLHFDMSFYRSKVLPFIQACLIAEGQRAFPPSVLPSNKQANKQTHNSI